MIFKEPENLIELNQMYPPHMIEFYQNIMCAYLGIMGEVIHHIDDPRETVLKYAQTPVGKSRLSRSFYGSKSESKSFSYDLMDISYECWTPGCEGNYFIFRVSPVEYVVVFNIGYRKRIDTMEVSQQDMTYLIKFIGKILGLLFSGAKRILLCGHSNGMVSATLTSVLLMCLADPTFASEFADRDILSYSLYQNVFQQYDPTLFVGIVDHLCVCGTGAFPLLFDDLQLFDYYFQTLKGRYLHVGLALKQEILNKTDLWVDYHMRPYTSTPPIYNYLYHIYSYPYGYFLDTVKKSKKRVGHITNALPEYVEYEGINVGTGFFKDEFEFELHMFNFYRVLLAPIFCGLF